MSSSLDRFKEDGYVLFKNVLTGEEINEFRAECEQLVQLPIDASHGDNANVKGNVLVRSEIILEMFLQEKIVNTIKEVCGENFCILPEISVMKSQYGRWHKDTTSVELFGYDFHKNEEFNVVNIAIYCQDNGEFGGGLDVVPGSHMEKDLYVDYYREEEERVAKASKAAGSLINRSIGWSKRAMKSTLVKMGLISTRSEVEPSSSKINHPLDSSDNKLNKFQVPTEVGDVVIFDLRLDHKASWPKTIINPESTPDKYVFFAICGANNATTRSYRDYLMVRSETQAAYSYLKNYEISESLVQLSEKLNVQVL